MRPWAQEIIFIPDRYQPDQVKIIARDIVPRLAGDRRC
jgi:hypothetical protein